MAEISIYNHIKELWDVKYLRNSKDEGKKHSVEEPRQGIVLYKNLRAWVQQHRLSSFICQEWFFKRIDVQRWEQLPKEVGRQSQATQQQEAVSRAQEMWRLCHLSDSHPQFNSRRSRAAWIKGSLEIEIWSYWMEKKCTSIKSWICSFNECKFLIFARKFKKYWEETECIDELFPSLMGEFSQLNIIPMIETDIAVRLKQRLSRFLFFDIVSSLSWSKVGANSEVIHCINFWVPWY